MLVDNSRNIDVAGTFYCNVIKEKAKYMVIWGITWRHPNQKSFVRAYAMGA